MGATVLVHTTELALQKAELGRQPGDIAELRVHVKDLAAAALAGDLRPEACATPSAPDEHGAIQVFGVTSTMLQQTYFAQALRRPPGRPPTW